MVAVFCQDMPQVAFTISYSLSVIFLEYGSYTAEIVVPMCCYKMHMDYFFVLHNNSLKRIEKVFTNSIR